MANVGSDSSFCTRRKTSKKRTSAGMSSSELQYICDIRFPQFEKMFAKNCTCCIKQFLVFANRQMKRGDFCLHCQRCGCMFMHLYYRGKAIFSVFLEYPGANKVSLGLSTAPFIVNMPAWPMCVNGRYYQSV